MDKGEYSSSMFTNLGDFFFMQCRIVVFSVLYSRTLPGRELDHGGQVIWVLFKPMLENIN